MNFSISHSFRKYLKYIDAFFFYLAECLDFKGRRVTPTEIFIQKLQFSDIYSFSLTISLIVIFIFGKLAFSGTQLNVMVVTFFSEWVLPCYRAAASLRSLSAQVALSCTEQICFISELPCHWGSDWSPLGSWTNSVPVTTLLAPLGHHSLRRRA